MVDGEKRMIDQWLVKILKTVERTVKGQWKKWWQAMKEIPMDINERKADEDTVEENRNNDEAKPIMLWTNNEKI